MAVAITQVVKDARLPEHQRDVGAVALIEQDRFSRPRNAAVKTLAAAADHCPDVRGRQKCRHRWSVLEAPRLVEIKIDEGSDSRGQPGKLRPDDENNADGNDSVQQELKRRFKASTEVAQQDVADYTRR